jgi:hypothetical protein
VEANGFASTHFKYLIVREIQSYFYPLWRVEAKQKKFRTCFKLQGNTNILENKSQVCTMTGATWDLFLLFG